MGPVLDGVPPHLRPFVQAADRPPVDVADVLRRTGADVLINFVPTGSDEAARFYAEQAIGAGVGFINGMPTLIASDPRFAAAAERHGAQLVGDDVKSQLGATVVHRVLTQLFADRGLRITRSSQLNWGGNTDFANLAQRGQSKSVTKEKAVKSTVPYDFPMGSAFSYMPGQGDQKSAVITIDGENFGGAPVRLSLKLDVEDSPNSAGVIIDALRCVKVARDRGIAGVLHAPSAALMKHPPRQSPEDEARRALESFIAGGVA
jgi:myo-inositol-1-phosphate synthase